MVQVKTRLIALLAGLATGGALLAQPAPLPASAADEAIYRERLATFLRDPGNYPYAPMEPMPGAARWVPLPVATPAQRAISEAALDQAQAYAAEMRSSALIVWQGGRVQRAWYGPGTTATTPLVTKSLSKPLGAIAVGRAIALGKLKSLDQPISAFIPELAGTQKGRILVRHLLDMRSGMLDQGFSTDPEHPLNRSLLDPDHGRRIVEGYPMIAEPGTRYSYANAPSDLVALVLERATGRRFGEFVTNEVLRPLGAQGGTVWVDRPGGLAHSGCCMYLPAETVLRLAILLLDDGAWQKKRLLPRGFAAQMRTGTPQNPNFGLGVWIGEPWQKRRGFGAPGTAGPQVLHSEAYADPDLYLFDGNSNQTVHIAPRARMIVLRMGPTPPPPSATAREWDNAVLPNGLLRGFKKPVPGLR